MFIGSFIVQQVQAADIRRADRSEVGSRDYHELNHEIIHWSCILIFRFTRLRKNIGGENFCEGSELQESQRI